MVNLKSDEEISIMAEGGKRLRLVVENLLPLIKDGITTKEIDDKAEELIKKQGGKSSFKTVPGYLFSICSPINEQIVHTKPSNRILKDGDVLTLDIGMLFKGWHTDYAITKVVGGQGKDTNINKFLKIGEETLYLAIKKARIGNRLGEISETIEKEITGHGHFIIKELTGHGIGKKLHEDPYVFGFVDRPINKSLLIKKGLVIAIEIIYAMGTGKMIYEEDNWSIITKDRSLSACFEHTIAVTDQGPVILT
ncbi:MAG: type I methionyl aminopeptidase [Candidatus Roizmanbacteria bacterium]|nr:type I methionyl aminopeptidase [Candidatus Roizmanbacteria bacterium]